MMTALKDPAAKLASKGLATFQALGDIGVSGAACVTTALSASAKASASVNVSVTASASFSSSNGM